MECYLGVGGTLQALGGAEGMSSECCEEGNDATLAANEVMVVIRERERLV